MSPEWLAVKRYAQTKMAAAQTELQTCPLEHVERVRGRVEAYRAILALESAETGVRTIDQFLNMPG